MSQLKLISILACALAFVPAHALAQARVGQPTPTPTPTARQGAESVPPRDQTKPLTTPGSPRRNSGREVEKLPELEQQSEITFHEYRPPIVRVFRDFTLKQGDSVREIVGVFGNVRIDGRVEGDVMVTGGSLTLGPTAIIDGSMAVFGGNAKVEAGASVRHSVVVIGGAMDAPPDFSPRYEQVIFGTPEIGDSLQALVPWFTKGFLWGRLFVPSLGWNWTIVFVSFLIGLVLSQVFSRQAGACADVINKRPVSVFLTGLLALLLAPVLLTIVAASVIGLIVVPFAIAAFLIAGMIGKVGVARAIGRSVVGESDPDSRLLSTRSFAIGVVIITFGYWLPVLGLMLWALVGVFGIGSATITLAARLKRERPVPPPMVPLEPPPVPPVPPSATPPYIAPNPSASYATSTPLVAEPPPIVSAEAPFADASFPDEPAGPPTPPPFQPSINTVGGLAAYPRAGFLDRLAAFALDITLIAIANNFVDRWWRDEGPFLFLVLGYHVAFWAWKGTTLGGIICNLRIVRTNGDDPRFIDALVRGLSGIFSIASLGIGCIWMINDAERQMWHDKIAGTVVVKLPRELVLA